jgi:hypothetical protein
MLTAEANSFEFSFSYDGSSRASDTLVIPRRKTPGQSRFDILNTFQSVQVFAAVGSARWNIIHPTMQIAPMQSLGPQLQVQAQIGDHHHHHHSSLPIHISQSTPTLQPFLYPSCLHHTPLTPRAPHPHLQMQNSHIIKNGLPPVHIKLPHPAHLRSITLPPLSSLCGLLSRLCRQPANAASGRNS